MPSEQEVLLDKWLEEKENAQLYNELHHLWLNIIRDNLTHQSEIDAQWTKMQKRINRSENASKRFTLKRSTILSAIASLFILCLISFSVYNRAKDNAQHSAITNTYSSLNGKSKVLLPDGSIVWLNTQSSLTYLGSFQDDKRVVSLQGEAYFEVTKDEKRPFIVSCKGIEVEVFGTTFNVDAHENIAVSLLSGSVAVKSAHTTKQINPGEVAICKTGSEEIKVEKRDVNFDALWARESISFERQSIRDLSSFLSKWYGVTILLDPTIPDEQAYTFKITTEPLEEILRLMARTNPIEYSFDENNTVKIKRRTT